jgi:heme/copper-type cytochrome/quinol oxidase subunit 2
MGKTLQVLDESLQHVKPHIFEPGREANCKATDHIAELMATYLQQVLQPESELVVPDGDEVEMEIEANDLV